jgi:uncharacterized damage-inducible protein DinB
MSTSAIGRPAATEHAPYYEKYVSLVPEGDILSILTRQADTTLSLLSSIPEAQADKRYAPDKWSIKEVVGHVVDCERIFSYRALTFARNDPTLLPGFEQDDYVRYAAFAETPLTDLAAEFESVRRANVYMFKSLAADAWLRSGNANGTSVTVRALAHIIAGHELHHIGILRERYL